MWNARRPAAGPPLRFNPPGRRCELTGCQTILNHCNPGPFCLLHTERVEASGIEHEGYARLWVAIQVKRREMREKGVAMRA